ncbi:MAG: hypothetical protein WCO54_02325 [Bacteroidota bacterium]
MKDLFPGAEGLLVAWCQNFKTQLPILAAQLNLTQQQITDYTALADSIITSVNDATVSKNDYKLKVDIKNSIIADKKQNLRAIANIIKANPAYTDGIGSSLGILFTPDAGIDTTTYKPDMSLVLGHGFVIVKFTKKGVEGVNVYTRLQGVHDWTFLSRDTHSPYDDHRMLAQPGTPENREYMVVGVINDIEIGLPSDIASITFAG